MQKTKQVFVGIGSCALYAFLMLAFQVVVAQTTDCPAYSQVLADNGRLTDQGMADDANINILLFNTSAGSFSNSDDAGSARDAAETAMDAWLSMPGNNQDYSVSNYSGSLSDTALARTGTAANPVVVVEQLSPTDARAKCNGTAPACSSPLLDSSGVTVGAIVWVSTEFVNGTPPADYPATLAQVLSHEIGVHDDMGWADCTGSNCGNSVSGGGLYTAPPGPMPCDIKQFKAQKKITC